MLTFEMIRIDEINEENKDEQENGIAINVERTKSVSSNYSKKGANNINSPVLLKDKITSNDLNENEENVYTGADYDLSKPVTLNVKKNVKKSENEKSKKSKSKEIKVELNSKLGELKRENSKYEDSIDNLRIKNIIKKFRQNNDLDNDRGITSKTIFEPKTAIFSLSNSMNIPIKSTLIEGIPEKDEEIPEDKKKMIDEEIKKEEIKQNKNIDLNKLRTVFGETFNEKGKSIKSSSLFGKINSHKIFRCIIKTHEDLRQEQFATQLINEFYQIYQLEHTGLWLNTYEIINRN